MQDPEKKIDREDKVVQYSDVAIVRHRKFDNEAP
jgi:hypothetical protein